MLDEELLNRTSVTVFAKQPFADWINQLPDDLGDLAIQLEELRQEPDVFLIPSFESTEEASVYFEKIKPQIFEALLEMWTVDPSLWPKKRESKVFDTWFDAHLGTVFDTCPEEPMWDDEEIEEEGKDSFNFQDFRASMEKFGRVSRKLIESGAMAPEEMKGKSVDELVAKADEIFGSGGQDPKSKAQDLIYDAWEEKSSKRRLELAHEALKLDPNCADAFNLLGEHARKPAEALECFRQGILAGEASLGKPYFDENRGHFWGLMETRPYMRALFNYAQGLWSAERREESNQEMWKLLELNPNDNQGVRYLLLNQLIAIRDFEGVEKLLKMFMQESSAQWLYSRVLYSYARRGAESKKPLRRLRDAMKENPYVPEYLLGVRNVPKTIPESYSMGSPEEAMIYRFEAFEAWKNTNGALDWLGKHLADVY